MTDSQPAAGGRAIASVSPPLRPMTGTGMASRLVIGQGSGLDSLDPFPALVHDDVPPQIRFPMHPHRGVEIITYGLGGALYHEDSLGNSGTVVPGGVERNLFGRGFTHSEAPVGDEPYRGFQLFTMLAPPEQQLEPSFQLLQPHEVPEVTAGGARIRVVAGEYAGAPSPLTLRNPTLYLDVELQPGAALDVPVPTDFQGLLYLLDGSGTFGTPARAARANQRLVLAPAGREAGDATLRVTADPPGPQPLRFVLIAGRPIFDR